MNICEIKTADVANGVGIRLTLFVSGCTNRCKGCFQPETWAFDYGEPFTDEVAEDILSTFEIPQSVIDGIYAEGKKQKVEPANDKEVEQTTKSLRQQLKALVARDIWDMSQYFQIMNETNDIVQKAVELIK